MTVTNKRSKQKTIPKAPRECCVCRATERVASITPLVYVKHAPLQAGRRVVICERCIVAATVGRVGTKAWTHVSIVLLASLREVYKAVRGVS